MASNQMFAVSGKKKRRSGLGDLDARLAMMAEARRLEQAEQFHEDSMAFQEKSLEEQKRQNAEAMAARRDEMDFTADQAKKGFGMEVAKFGLGQGLGGGLGGKKLFGEGGMTGDIGDMLGFGGGSEASNVAGSFSGEGISKPRVGSEMGMLAGTGSTQIGGTPSVQTVPKFGEGGSIFDPNKMTLGNTVGAGALGYGIGTLFGGKKKKLLGAGLGALGGGLMGMLGGGGLTGGLSGGLFGGLGGALSGLF